MCHIILLYIPAKTYFFRYIFGKILIIKPNHGKNYINNILHDYLKNMQHSYIIYMHTIEIKKKIKTFIP